MSFYRKPLPRPQQQQQHRLNLGGAAGGGACCPPRSRKKSGYARPQFAGPMELETLMEEGAAPGREEGDAQSKADGGGGGGGIVGGGVGVGCVRAPLTLGDKTQPDDRRRRQQQQQQRLRKHSAGTTKTAAAMKSNSERPHSVVNLYLAACTGQYYCYCYCYCYNDARTYVAASARACAHVRFENGTRVE